MAEHSLGNLPMWARRMLSELEHAVAQSEQLHSRELHKLRLDIIHAEGARRLAEQELGYAKFDLRRLRSCILILTNAISSTVGANEVPQGMDPREWIA